MSKGLRIDRRFTETGRDPYEKIRWARRDSKITNPDGSVVFEMKGAEIPADWSQVAGDIMVSKYFRKAGVPQFDEDGNQIFDENGQPVLGPERSARQVFDRLAGTWRHWGEKEGYFATPEDAQAFEDELKYMLATQMAAPNSPQWFNTGLNWSYGLTGPAQGFWYVDSADERLKASPDSYSRPSPHACFILGIKDDLVNPGGIMDLWVREARIFKFGSGAGSNFSAIRAENEPLSGGGKSSGVMSFLKIGDRAAGAIKSGGTTRRAAKMVILDVDHPDIEKFVEWKKVEEEKAKILIKYGGYPSDFNGEAYATVSGQNSNNSVRVTNEFLKAVEEDGDWDLINRTDGQVRKTIKARDLWTRIAEAAWACADPGLQFDTTINEWHTSPAGGRIRASNPCFTGDTRIATDKGLIPFKTLVKRVAEGESFQVYTHDATNPDSPSETIDLTSPTQVMVTGTNQILRLEFSDGRVLRCTPNHRLWTQDRGWVRADELTEDDRVRLLDQEIDFGMASWAIPVSTDPSSYQRQSSRKYAVRLPEKWSEDLAHYLGWLVGDGSITDTTAVTIYGTTEEQHTAMLLHRELLAEMNGGHAPKPVEMGNGTYQLRATRGAIRKFFEALGVSRSKAADKRVPWSVFEAPKPIVAAFLRGLYDADGCVRWGETTRYVGLGSVSKGLLRDVQQLLDTFGVHGSIYGERKPQPKAFAYTTKAGEHRTYAGHQGFDLRIMGKDLERFFDAIGFGLAVKDDILHQMLVETTRNKTRHWVRLKERTEDGWETTYNLTEPKNHSYLAGGVLVSNCSEYLFLDDTACNLASINLVKFYDDETGVFDIEAYTHAIRLWTIVLEISVAMAHFPSKEIARGSYDYRTLGLGYANLGSLLMRQGIAYDSDEGRAIAGALTAILTGQAYATSAEIAETTGPFPKYEENREAMLRVIRNHRRAAYGDTDYEEVTTDVMAIDPELCPEDLLQAASKAWDLALERGEKFGYRNAQATVLAPTGTIGLLMDCDTTGVEPDFALVKFKKLAGGGYFKIVNQSVAPALRHLGYTETQIAEIVTYIGGTSSIDGAPHINRETLKAKGFSDEDLAKLESTLPAVFELKHAFNAFTFGEDTMRRLGFSPEEYSSFDSDMLRELGFTTEQILEANDHICGRQTIEGAPHLRDEHLPVFDTANRNGRTGKRFIHHNGHIKMMAAAQPFISGAISKCVTGETLLSTADGLIRIRDLHQDEAPDTFRDEVIEVASLDGTQKTDAFYYGGKRQVRTVEMRSGHRVTGTPNHRLLTARDGELVWRRLDEIEPGEYVAVRYGADLWSPLAARFDDFSPSDPYDAQKPVRIPEEMTDELAFLIGAYVAEGHIARSNWTITITNSDEAVLTRVRDAWRSQFDVEPRIVRSDDRCPAVEVASKRIVEFFDYLGCGEGSAAKRIPDAVLRSPRSMVLSFLQGLFLDGYVTTEPAAKMAICVDSSELLDDLQAVLTNLGVVHSRITKHNVEYNKDFDEVYAAGSEAQILARMVPFVESHKRAVQLELLERTFAQSTSDMIPGLDPRDLYEMIPKGKSGRNGWGERRQFSFLLDPRTKHVSRRTLERVAMLPMVDLPEWLQTILADGIHFSPVEAVTDAGTRDVYDVSVPTNHAFVGNGIVNHNTINMPNEVTPEEIEDAYMLSWKLGLKAMALYRDGSKASQPLSATADEGEEIEDEPAAITESVEKEKALHWGNIPVGISPTQAYAQGMKPPRFLLPARRRGFNQEARVGGHKIFLRTGEYDDGTLGEIFIDLAKEGATLKGILSCFAIAVSKGLQYGVPLEEFVDTFTFQTFEPRGVVEGHPNIKMANSIIDYVFRALGVEYLHRDELAQVPPVRDGDIPGPPKGIAVDAGVQLDLSDAAAERDVDAVKAAAEFVAAGGAPDGAGDTVDMALSEKMGDAPVCSNCGHMTVRNGSCYVCLTCGDTTGCS
ncbi:MAG: LAGLIDADG family homing endonuclease [Acidimicrobiia bacterium]